MALLIRRVWLGATVCVVLFLASCASIPSDAAFSAAVAEGNLERAEERIEEQGGYEANPELSGELALAYRTGGDPQRAEAVLSKVAGALETSLAAAVADSDDREICYYAGLLGKGEEYCTDIVLAAAEDKPERAVEYGALAGLYDLAYQEAVFPMTGSDTNPVPVSQLHRLWGYAQKLGRETTLLEDLRDDSVDEAYVDRLVEYALEVDDTESVWFLAKNVFAHRRSEGGAIAATIGREIDLYVEAAVHCYEAWDYFDVNFQTHMGAAEAVDVQAAHNRFVELGTQSLSTKSVNYDHAGDLAVRILEYVESPADRELKAVELTGHLVTFVPEKAMEIAERAGSRSGDAFRVIAESLFQGDVEDLQVAMEAVRKSEDTALVRELETQYPYRLIELVEYLPNDSQNLEDALDIASDREDGSQIAESIIDRFGPGTHWDDRHRAVSPMVLRAARIAGVEQAVLEDYVQVWSAETPATSRSIYERNIRTDIVAPEDLLPLVYDAHSDRFFRGRRIDRDQTELVIELLEDFGVHGAVGKDEAIATAERLFNAGDRRLARRMASLVGEEAHIENMAFVADLRENVSREIGRVFGYDQRIEKGEELYRRAVEAGAAQEAATALTEYWLEHGWHEQAIDYAERAGDQELLRRAHVAAIDKVFDQVRYQSSPDEDLLNQAMEWADAIGETEAVAERFFRNFWDRGRRDAARFFVPYAGEEVREIVRAEEARRVAAEFENDLSRLSGILGPARRQTADAILEKAIEIAPRADLVREISIAFMRAGMWEHFATLYEVHGSLIGPATADELFTRFEDAFSITPFTREIADTAQALADKAGRDPVDAANAIAHAAAMGDAYDISAEYSFRAGNDDLARIRVVDHVESLLEAGNVAAAETYAEQSGIAEAMEAVEQARADAEFEEEMNRIWPVLGPITQEYVDGDIDEATYLRQFEQGVSANGLTASDVELLIQYYLNSAMHAMGGGNSRAARANQEAAEALSSAWKATAN